MFQQMRNELLHVILWCMLFMDDIVLVDGNMTGVEQKFEFVEMNFGGKMF
jgi:hypothetical protein